MNKISVERIVLSILILLIVVLLTLVIALLDGKIKIPANQRQNGRGQSLSLTINYDWPRHHE
jgi:preprotein translocase subunit SecY